MSNNDLKQTGHLVIITTSFRGVYFGRLLSRSENTCLLGDARMCIYWGTTEGVDELAATGPTAKSKIGARVRRVRLFGLTSIADVSPEAAAKWEALK